ncbi:DUF4259 domain-containing protein [Streptomyces scopuliridis]|uniref:DUF4259 domain-containing protein n=1 Tax=Streptomyces scopuliridis TaxID=452529 RepID=A0ACD4ZPV3_9ACTN|nr:DUF4259 domain-containing protein [Streptomyces scopuliridis]WSB36165.1 DUF4259 domain-containing protein [Streptomyces scopuliridis]WSC00461.1 DUF4259 domain-containing protein [Streptomyces scopuliridis]WSC05927.1 DUF4259 domain-containing protein [Streptomyces scopuliridis]
MGTWDTGHFDNDAAVDFSADLDEVTVERRTEIVRAALLRAVGGDSGDVTGGPLDGEVGAAAVAAAALVAAQCPGGPPVESVYGPEEPLPRLPEELRELALLALDRVSLAGSEVRDRWVKADGENGAWHHGMAELRAALTAAITGPGGSD